MTAFHGAASSMDQLLGNILPDKKTRPTNFRGQWRQKERQTPRLRTASPSRGCLPQVRSVSRPRRRTARLEKKVPSLETRNERKEATVRSIKFAERVRPKELAPVADDAAAPTLLSRRSVRKFMGRRGSAPDRNLIFWGGCSCTNPGG